MGDRVIFFETMIFMQRVNGVKERPGLCINVTIEFKVLEPHTALYKNAMVERIYINFMYIYTEFNTCPTCIYYDYSEHDLQNYGIWEW